MSGAPDQPELVDLRKLVRDRGWPPGQIASFRSMCSVAAGKASLPADEREFAAAVVAALDGRSPGISRAHMQLLAATDLLSFGRDDSG